MAAARDLFEEIAPGSGASREQKTRKRRRAPTGQVYVDIRIPPSARSRA